MQSQYQISIMIQLPTITIIIRNSANLIPHFNIEFNNARSLSNTGIDINNYRFDLQHR